MYGVLIFVLLTVGCSITEGASTPQQTVMIPTEEIAKMLNVALKCVEEDPGLDSSTFIAVVSQKYEETDEVKRLMFCTLKGTGYTLETGLSDIEKTLSIYPDTVDKAAVRVALEKCQKGAENEKEPKEIFFKIFKCFQTNTPVHWVVS